MVYIMQNIVAITWVRYPWQTVFHKYYIIMLFEEFYNNRIFKKKLELKKIGEFCHHEPW